MNCLIVEDDENKSSQILQFMAERFPHATLRTARSLQSSIRQLLEKPPDLVLLDMTLPDYDTGPDEPGGHLHPLGGSEFLSQMERFERIIPVIVVTQFETFGKGAQAMNVGALERLLQKEHPRVYRGLVYYHAAVQGWRQRLDLLVREVILDGPGGANA